MEFLLIILLVVGIVLSFFIKAQKQASKKDTVVKKFEIIDYYKEQMKELLLRYKNDNDILTKEKIKLLKKINQELSMNIYFDEQEAKQILKDLTNME